MNIYKGRLWVGALLALTSCSGSYDQTGWDYHKVYLSYKVKSAVPGTAADLNGGGFNRGGGVELPTSPETLPSPMSTPGGDGSSEGGGRSKSQSLALQSETGFMKLSAVQALRLSMRINPGFVRLAIGTQEQLNLTVQDSNGKAINPATLPIIWFSSNPAAVTVNSQGQVRMVGNGYATITAHLATNPSVMATAGVSNGQTGLTIVPGSVQFTLLGQQQQLQAEIRDENGQLVNGAAVTWSSAQPGVASINAQGMVTMTGAGFANVTATLTSNPSIQATVPVTSGGLRVQIQPGQFAYTQVGQQQQMQAQVFDANGQPVSANSAGLYWYSSDPTVATVTATGLVQVVGNGNALITAAVSADPNAAANAWVSPARPSLRIFPGAYTFNTQGEQRAFQALLYDANGQLINTGPLNLIWSSSAPGSISVNAQGIATVNSAGFATLTASLSGDPSVTASVQVSFQTSSGGGGGGGSGGGSGSGEGGTGSETTGGTLDTLLDFN